MIIYDIDGRCHNKPFHGESCLLTVDTSNEKEPLLPVDKHIYLYRFTHQGNLRAEFHYKQTVNQIITKNQQRPSVCILLRK